MTFLLGVLCINLLTYLLMLEQCEVAIELLENLIIRCDLVQSEIFDFDEKTCCRAASDLSDRSVGDMSRIQLLYHCCFVLFRPLEL